MKDVSKKIEQLFIEKFNNKPRLFFSPGRINLIGEHVDYNAGFVMPSAIDKGIVFAVAPNNTNTMRAYSSDYNEMLTIDLKDVKKMDSWKNYILGVVDQMQQKKFPIKGFDVVFGGDLPVGAGLSSSAAVECGLAFALNTIFNLGIDRVNIALIGQKAEHTYPGVKCGIMDQFANMMGQKDHVLLLDCNSLEYEALPLQLPDHVIMLINTKVHHSLASGEYNVRRQQCEEGFAILKKEYPQINTFRDVKPSQVQALEGSMKPVVYNRCLFVTQEIERTKTGAEFLKTGMINEFGNLMYLTHDGLSRLYEVSCPELDYLIEQAKLHKGIIGARVMGGGFGGCTINITDKNNYKEIAAAITKEYKAKFNIDAEVYIMQTSDGTNEL